ncbi:hypothetical protein D917_05499 [Trichinella nativa]|uniref:Uncharacterized protein n=1 Tax=Trichinella nativa TaxID=6335 RepID=A0A1Y3EW00_9BILA|nr:hypothetical protein D917_05499 [Trichinella nativa]
MARSRRNSALCESEMENLSCNFVCEKNFTSHILAHKRKQFPRLVGFYRKQFAS